MDKRRIAEKNRAIASIKDLTIANIRDTKQLRVLISNPNLALQEKLEAQIENRKSQIDTLNYRLSNIDYGDFDDEINAQYISNTKQKNSNTSVLKNNQKISSSSSSNFTSSHTNDAKDWRSSYSYFKRTSETLPDYINKNLATMPSNKGYIWRDVIFFGHKQHDPSLKMTILFEKQSDNSLNIHEWTRDSIRIYNKNGNTKTLISHTRRN